jgi:hypothetical protein
MGRTQVHIPWYSENIRGCLDVDGRITLNVDVKYITGEDLDWIQMMHGSDAGDGLF